MPLNYLQGMDTMFKSEFPFFNIPAIKVGLWPRLGLSLSQPQEHLWILVRRRHRDFAGNRTIYARGTTAVLVL